MPKVEEATEVAVDYPREGEKITSPDYAFRVGAGAPGTVEISIDNGEWRPCRQAEGYAWYDWSGYKAGKHQVVARVQAQNGQKATSETCRFLVELP